MCVISYADLAPSNFILAQTSIPDTWIEVGVYFGWEGARSAPHQIGAWHQSDEYRVAFSYAILFA
jgi:hypothetical protein